MTKEEIKELFINGIDCSQVVTGYFADELDMDQKVLRKAASCFGGGMQCGETCGAVTGGLMVIGLKYGHFEEKDYDQKKLMSEKISEFKGRFLNKYDSGMCRELLGHDISKPGELDKVMEKGLMFEFCPKVVAEVIKILEKML